MNIKSYTEHVQDAYKHTNRSVLEASAMLQIEASELSELFLKGKWYGKVFNCEQILSEAGDILNFLTFILSECGLSLEQAMDNNIIKLKDREWITND